MIKSDQAKFRLRHIITAMRERAIAVKSDGHPIDTAKVWGKWKATYPEFAELDLDQLREELSLRMAEFFAFS